MNGCLSNLGTALTLVIAVSILVALVTQIFYILWRRRNLHNRSVPDDTESVLAVDSSSSQLTQLSSCAGKTSLASNPKRLTIIQLQTATKYRSWMTSSSGRHCTGCRGFCSLSRRKREGLDSETTYSSCAEKELKTTTKVYLEECYGVPDVAVTVVSIEVDEAFMTPFETPCASLPYYTPSPSPTRE